MPYMNGFHDAKAYLWLALEKFHHNSVLTQSKAQVKTTQTTSSKLASRVQTRVLLIDNMGYQLRPTSDTFGGSDIRLISAGIEQSMHPLRGSGTCELLHHFKSQHVVL